jgi:release factor glutamine methyltransferase
MSMSVKEILNLAERQLLECGVADAARDNKTLLCFMLGIPTSRLIMEYQNTLQDLLCEEYFKLIDRRSSGEPLQYIVGSQGFMGLDFKVNPSVLIPRQDTETAVELAMKEIDERSGSKRRIRDVLDLACGSGAIGISLAKLCKGISVTCSDVSPEAVALAKINIEKIKPDNKVKFSVGDLFEPFNKKLGKKHFDLIISNPPYIKSDVIPTLQREVKDHEPIAALDGGEDGLDFYRRIACEAPNYLKKRGLLIMEIGIDQREDVTNLLYGSGVFESIRCEQDLTHRDRVIIAEKSE